MLAKLGTRIDLNHGKRQLLAMDGARKVARREELRRESPPPTAHNGVVYVSGSGFGGSIFALDEATDARLSPSVSVLGGDSTPAVTDSSAFGGYACNQVYSFAPSSLQPIWHDSASCYGSGAKTPVYASGELFTRYYSGNLVLDAATGALLRTYTGDNITSLAPAADASRLFT